MIERPSWPEIWAEMARAVARRSRCVRSQVGAVIVDRRQRVLATSYNGPPANYGPARKTGDCTAFCERGRSGPTDATRLSYRDCPANHAEINGLIATDRTDREGGAIYVTGHVCLSCAKAVANSGLSVVYLVDADDRAEAHREPELSIGLLTASGLKIRRIGS
jgi:dCMP deaminase